MLRIALAQINTTVGDLEGNGRKISEGIVRAREVSADIVAFPEMAITGYPPEDLLLKKHFVDDNRKVLKKILPVSAHIVAIVGFVDADDQGRLYNAAAVIHDKKLVGVYHKVRLPNYGVFDEKRYFVPGEKNPVFAVNGVTIGVSICEDIWVLDGPCKEQAQAGAQVLINISSSPYHCEKWKMREKALRPWARKYKTFTCYTNLTGGQDELVFDGGSFILDPSGKRIALGKQFEEDLVVADLDIPARRKVSQNTLKVFSIKRSIAEDARLSIKGKDRQYFEPVEEMFRALVLGTRDYVSKNGFKKVVVGLSGGIDSALVAVIAREAVGKENVIGVTMPSRFSSTETLSDAKLLTKNLGIRCIEVPIQGIFEVYLKALEQEFSQTPQNIAEENLQARIRGNLLMAFSNKFGWLVLTTGNKSEIAVGYCTLYGDMSGGFAVIKDVPKVEVYKLSEFVNRSIGHVIPESIIRRAPTAELRDNQKDQDTLPAYEDLDPLLKSYVEEHRSWAEMVKRHKSEDMIKKVVKMVDQSEYKRRQAPPGIKITPRAFGKDWRLPITNKYKEF